MRTLTLDSRLRGSDGGGVLPGVASWAAVGAAVGGGVDRFCFSYGTLAVAMLT